MSTLDEMLAKTGMREAGFRAIIGALPTFGPLILETGCARKEDNWRGDGMSTLIWDEVVRLRKGVARTCDINPESVAFARTQVSARTEVFCDDGVRWLSCRPPRSAHLLYLDSLDVDFQDFHDGAMQSLLEFVAGRHTLLPGALVAVDDNLTDDGWHKGKGAYIADYFARVGIEPIYKGYQWVWRMP